MDRLGPIWYGPERLGMDPRQGLASGGKVWQGMSWHGEDPRCGMAGVDMAGFGTARQGMSWHGQAGRGLISRQGMACLGDGSGGHGLARTPIPVALGILAGLNGERRGERPNFPRRSNRSYPLVRSQYSKSNSFFPAQQCSGNLSCRRNPCQSVGKLIPSSLLKKIEEALGQEHLYLWNGLDQQ